MAKLYFRYSSMGAGKSLDLLKVAHNYKEKNKKIVILTSAKDNRHEIGIIKSRVGLKEKALCCFFENTNIFDIIDEIKQEEKPCCVLIDESQFLTKQQVKQLTDVVDKLNISVICYGLRNDFKGEPFEGSCYLLTLADTIEEIKTICHCGRKAVMNLRVNGDNPVYEGKQIEIGGNEKYVAVCRKHYKEGKIK